MVYARPQLVELAARLVSLGKSSVEARRADSVIAAAVRADAKPVQRSAEFLESLVAATLIRIEIRRDAVLGTGLAILAHAITRVAGYAVFISDGPPVGRETLVCVHRGAAGERPEPGENAERCQRFGNSHGVFTRQLTLRES